jgi:beta-glucosidase
VVQAGIGQFLDDHVGPTTEALEQNLLTEAEIDAALRGNFRVMIRLGLLDPPERVPYAQIGIDGSDEPWLSEAHKKAAREVTQKSIVLLKNEANLLPLDSQRLASLAVLGPLADQVHLDWYSGSPPYAVTPLQGIRNRVGSGVSITYQDGSDIEAAVQAAHASDAAIVFVGHNPVGAGGWAKVNSPDEGREAVDRHSLSLPDAQEMLIRRVWEANPKTIVVLVSSFPYAITWAQDHVPAIVQSVHNSQELGHALADVLFGDYNPAGRLVQTWPRSLEQLPPMMDYDIRHGRTYAYFQGEPLYPFGYGLSYTQFAYSHLRTSAGILAGDGTLTVSVDITNTGKRAGEEVVQLYIRHLASHVARPKRELQGFQRIAIAPGETQTVTMTLAASQLAYWDTPRHRFVVEAGTLQLLVGRSSADIALEKTIAVTSST